jgi:hypothetical protein
MEFLPLKVSAQISPADSYSSDIHNRTFSIPLDFLLDSYCLSSDHFITIVLPCNILLSMISYLEYCCLEVK